MPKKRRHRWKLDQVHPGIRNTYGCTNKDCNAIRMDTIGYYPEVMSIRAIQSHPMVRSYQWTERLEDHRTGVRTHITYDSSKCPTCPPPTIKKRTEALVG